MTDTVPQQRTRLERTRGYDPEPFDVNPLWKLPPNPVAIAKWAATSYLWWQTGFFYLLGYVAWRWLTPALDTYAALGVGDMAILTGRNLALMVLLIGGQHYALYMRRTQGTDFKYESRWPAASRRSFTFNNQVRDNMFWSLAAAPTAAIYEAVMFRLYAGGSIPQLDAWWTITLMAAATPFIGGVHFYANHRLLHVDPLYKWFHSLHHRNVNTGPWSGVSMHPVEHVLYLSLPFVFLVIPGHPYLITFSLLWLLIAPSPSHSGFHRWKIFTTDVQGGDIFHNLHHRYFEVNYGMALVPMDKWFGTWHDGSMEAHQAMKDRKRDSLDAKDTDAVVGDS
ncbi:MAG: sterol desaturase family protein [Actinomycetota bacterium]